MNNNNKTRSKRITFRLSETDMATLRKKMDYAGYATESAFIRDGIINCQQKEKKAVSLAVIEVQRELMKLASMINAERPYAELLDQAKKVSAVSLGGGAS